MNETNKHNVEWKRLDATKCKLLFIFIYSTYVYTQFKYQGGLIYIFKSQDIGYSYFVPFSKLR